MSRLPPGLLTLALLWALPQNARTAQAPSPAPDSTVYPVDPGSRLVVETRKAGLFGFARHTDVIHGHAENGERFDGGAVPHRDLRARRMQRGGEQRCAVRTRRERRWA